MKRYGILVWLAIFYAVLFRATPVLAQLPPIAPTTATFTHADVDFNITSVYHLDFFTCASVSTAGVCTGQAVLPIQAGVDVPRAQVTGTAASRVISLTAGSTPTLLASVPVGTGIVAQIKAVGDATQPGIGGTSAYSPPSNGFFAAARTPAAPGKPTPVQ